MKAKERIRTGSFDWAIVREALRRAMPPAEKPSGRTGLSDKIRDVEISVLLNDVFGGEILRTPKGKGWHFYNRINDECVDLAGQVFNDSYDYSVHGKNTDSPADTSGYFEQNDYTKFFLRFVIAFEETVGLGKYKLA